MKLKILAISFAALIILILIFISLLISRESAKIQPALEKNNPPQIVTQQPSAFLEQTARIPPAFEHRPAITIIKPQPKENSVPASEEKINKRQQPIRLPASSSQSPVVSAGEPQEQPVSGTTEIGKHPTEEEKKEMNAQGIIMY